uniref:Hemoglobin, beta adult 1 n=1 Tax=Oryzias latipes TaxID=8090 RepID=A0A3B3HGW9_ORYLA
MFEWTDAERSAITSLWGKIDVGEIGQQALTGEHLIMYPWTQRHFASFGNLSTNAVILGNPKVGQHGKVVKWAGERSEEHGQHQEHLHKAQNSTWILTTSGYVINVQLLSFFLTIALYETTNALAECITVCITAKFGPQVFTVGEQEAWLKFLSSGRLFHKRGPQC